MASLSTFRSSSFRSGLALAVALAPTPPLAADVEADLRAELVGRFALTRTALLSECTDSFTNVKIVGERASGGRGVRFEAGELVEITNVKSGPLAGLDLFVELVVPYRLAFEDGPFTLYELRRCRVELEFDVDRATRKDLALSLAAIERAVELHPSEAAARAAGWNGRVPESFPDDWEETQRAYAIWKVEETNRRVRAKTEEVLAVARQTLTYMSNDDDYLASFGAGARARSDSWSDCPAMLRATFSVSGSGTDSKGWADGQRVAWAARLGEALQDCYLESD